LDSQNRLVSCTANGVTSMYTYGADGLRRSATVNGVTTYYVYDGTMLVREMQQNAQGVLQSTATYLNGPRGPEYRRDDTQAEGTYTDASGTQHPAGKTRWYVYDGLGSVVGEVDPSGNLTSSGTFDVYGAKRQGGTGTATSRQGFVGSLGHVSDAETGLVYMRARYYDPNVGRFVSQDPAGHGSNWYAYCNNNPTNSIDATGCDAATIASLINVAMAVIAGGEYDGAFVANMKNLMMELLEASKGASIDGVAEIAAGEETVESSGASLNSQMGLIQMRLGEIQQGLGAESLAWGVAGRLAALQCIDAVLMAEDGLHVVGLVL